jgi:hypothetical protein
MPGIISRKIESDETVHIMRQYAFDVSELQSSTFAKKRYEKIKDATESFFHVSFCQT